MDNSTQNTIDLSKISAADLEILLEKKRKLEHEQKMNRTEAYEGIRESVVMNIEQKVRQVTSDVIGLYAFVCDETEAFKQVMAEYGKLKTIKGNLQEGFSIRSENFRIIVKSNKYKGFDERADIAAERLVEFLRNYIKSSEKGTDDPMYQLTMALIERNSKGDLDYGSISKLYECEEKFNSPDYSEIMQLFRESNIVEGSRTYFTFEQKNHLGVWLKLEPSFNRL